MADDPKRQADRIIDALEKYGFIGHLSPIAIEGVRATIVRVLSPEQPTFEALALAVTDSPDDGWPADYWQQFWAAYPRRKAPDAAKRALDKVRKSGKVDFAVILAAVEVYSHETRNRAKEHIAHPATWLNGGCWKSEPDGQNSRGEVKNGFMGRLMDPS